MLISKHYVKKSCKEFGWHAIADDKQGVRLRRLMVLSVVFSNNDNQKYDP